MLRVLRVVQMRDCLAMNLSWDRQSDQTLIRRGSGEMTSEVKPSDLIAGETSASP